MYYVIADIHGCYDEFMVLKDKIERQDKAAIFIIAGDIMDRGPKVAEILAWFMKNANQPDGKYQLLMGNHEELIIDWYDCSFLPWWNRKSVDFDYREMPSASFDFRDLLIQNGFISREKIQPIIDFFRELPLFTIVETNDKKYVIAHAWAPKKDVLSEILAGREVTPQERSIFLWDRRIGECYDNDEYDLVYGHTPTLNASTRKKAAISKYMNTINIDCGCVFHKKYGRLAALCLDTGEEYYVRQKDNKI